MVLVFYRGGWCPYCNLHLRGFANSGRKLAGSTTISPRGPMVVGVLLFKIVDPSDLHFAFEAIGAARASRTPLRPWPRCAELSVTGPMLSSFQFHFRVACGAVGAICFRFRPGQ